MSKVVLVLLVLLNLFLAANLVKSGSTGADGRARKPDEMAERESGNSTPTRAKATALIPIEKPTEFTSVYAMNPATFAANLRQAGCPEETVRDILAAEIGRRYRSREEDLRPKP